MLNAVLMLLAVSLFGAVCFTFFIDGLENRAREEGYKTGFRDGSLEMERKIYREEAEELFK